MMIFFLKSKENNKKKKKLGSTKISMLNLPKS